MPPCSTAGWINEDDITSGGNTFNYERIIQFLKDVGSAPDGIGIQGHINQDWGRIRTPEQVYAQLDRVRTDPFRAPGAYRDTP